MFRLDHMIFTVDLGATLTPLTSAKTDMTWCWQVRLCVHHQRLGWLRSNVMRGSRTLPAYNANSQRTDIEDGLEGCDFQALRPGRTGKACAIEDVPVHTLECCDKDGVPCLNRDGTVRQDVPLMVISHGKVLEQQELRVDCATGGVLGLQKQQR